LANIDWFQ